MYDLALGPWGCPWGCIHDSDVDGTSLLHGAEAC